MIHTVSLPTARKLRENGFRQDTELSHVLAWGKYQIAKTEKQVEGYDIFFAAPTSDEILEELPATIIGKVDSIPGEHGLIIEKFNSQFDVSYGDFCQREHKELCEALADTWLFLKQQNLLQPELRKE